jgi:hypothetical protein
MPKPILTTVVPTIKDVLKTIQSAAQHLFANWQTLLIALALYAALLLVVYLFFGVIKEATNWEVFLSVFVLPGAALVLFFLLQRIGLGYTRDGATPVPLLKRALRDCWKLLLASLPTILLACLTVYVITLLNPEPTSGSTPAAPSIWEKIGWGIWYALLCFALPLLAIHSWIAAAHEGVDAALKILGRRILTVFSLRSMLTYCLIVIPFAALACFLFLGTTYIDSDWGELWLFGLRLVLAFLTIFVGWLILLGALVELNSSNLSRPMQADE